MDEKQNQAVLGQAIRNACQRTFGVLDKSFLCQSIGALHFKKPICLSEESSLLEVVEALQKNKIGSVLLVDKGGALRGIFTERDCVLKVMQHNIDLKAARISDYMTKDPTSEFVTATVAYALTLMSHGGFRHIPIVDDEKRPIGVLSVKDIVDLIVTKMTDDLLGFEEFQEA